MCIRTEWRLKLATKRDRIVFLKSVQMYINKEFEKMEIKRDSYLTQLVERKNNGMVKVITGIRRCGKSFLLFTIFKRYLLESGINADHIIEIALDGIENEELRNPKLCYAFIKDTIKDGDPYYLLLDEVQFMPRFEEVLNSLLRVNNISM